MQVSTMELETNIYVPANKQNIIILPRNIFKKYYTCELLLLKVNRCHYES